MYNYYKAIKEDVKNALVNYLPYYDKELEIDELLEKLEEDMWIDDSVTGNGSGSYTMSREEAKKCIDGNLDLLVDALYEFDKMDDIEFLKRALLEPEWADVTIRCSLLYGAISEQIDEIYQEYKSLEG